MTLEYGPPFLFVCLTLCLSVQFVTSVTKDVSFETDCGNTISLNLDDQAVVKEKQDSTSAGSSDPNCEITFKANDLDGRLCIDMTNLNFSNGNLQLDYYDNLETTTVSTKKFTVLKSFSLPFELCTTQRYATFRVKRTASVGTLNDIDLEFTVRHIKSTGRVVYMDSGCSNNKHHLEFSTVTVKNRHSGSSGPPALPGLCTKIFEYDGQSSTKVVCLTYVPGKNPSLCGFNMRVLDGTETSFTAAHTYTCSQSTPSKWCGKTKAITLELTRTGSNLASSNEPDDLFTVQLEDKASTSTSTPGNGASKLTPMFLSVFVSLLGGLTSLLY